MLVSSVVGWLVGEETRAATSFGDGRESTLVMADADREEEMGDGVESKEEFAPAATDLLTDDEPWSGVDVVAAAAASVRGVFGGGLLEGLDAVSFLLVAPCGFQLLLARKLGFLLPCLDPLPPFPMVDGVY